MKNLAQNYKRVIVMCIQKPLLYIQTTVNFQGWSYEKKKYLSGKSVPEINSVEFFAMMVISSWHWFATTTLSIKSHMVLDLSQAYTSLNLASLANILQQKTLNLYIKTHTGLTNSWNKI